MTSLRFNRLSRSLVQAAATVLLAAVGAGAAAASDPASVSAFAGRGVFGFRASIACPFRDSNGAPAECNRVALDDADTHATLDAGSHVIRFANPRAYARKTIVGDVLLQGSGVSDGGLRVPLNFHIVLSKSSGKWSINSHAHAPVRGNFTDVQVDAWQVEAGDPRAGGVVITPAMVRATLARPGLMARVAGQFVEVTDNRTATAADPDVTIGIGLGPAAFPVMRASLHADPVAKGDLDAVLRQGTWALKLQALSGKLPADVVRREMFLFGMSAQPALEPLQGRRFHVDESLVVGAVDGKGYLQFGDLRQDFPEAAQTGLAFMQQSFIGLVLGWEQSNARPATH